jgi:polysaccharide pyruvyl transferase WcaK-like protein
VSYTDEYDGFDSLFQAERPLTKADVQREVINTLTAVQQTNAAIQQAVAEARQRAEQGHPAFLERYGDTATCQRKGA